MISWLYNEVFAMSADHRSGPPQADAPARAAITALILAGGRATRLGGRDKREIMVEGRTIFERQVEVLAPRVAEIVVSAPRPMAGYRTVSDPVVRGGPLAGIAAGLVAAATPWLLVVAGDMPHVSGAVLDLICQPIAESALEAPPVRAGEPPTRRRIDAVALRIGGMPQPLLCALRVGAAQPVVTGRLAAGQLKASQVFTDGELAVRWIEESVVRGVDPTLRALFNVNAPEDLTLRS